MNQIIAKCRYDMLLIRLFVVLALILILIVRIRLLSVPLERDEGEFAYAGKLLLTGLHPFESVYNLKMPGIYLSYAIFFAAFGTSVSAIHLGLMIANLVTIVLMYLFAKKISGHVAGLVSAAAYGLMSLHYSVQGVFAHATHFVVLFAIAGLLTVWKAMDDNHKDILFLGGMLLGISFLMKQNGFAFVLLGLFLIFSLSCKNKAVLWRKIIMLSIVYLLGTALPFLLNCIILYRKGMLDRFWFWTISYASHYVTMLPFDKGMAILWENIYEIVDSSLIIWIYAIIGFIYMIKNRWFFEAKFVLFFIILSIIAVSPGFHFRPHYFILILPVVSILSGIGVQYACKITNCGNMQPKFGTAIKPNTNLSSNGLASLNILNYLRFIVISLLPISLIISILGNASYYLTDTPIDVSYKTYPAQFFPESLEIGKFLKTISKENDRIAILGSEPQIYFYANRRSSSGYIYMYPLMEVQEYALKMQEEMVNEIESTKPRFIVFYNSQPSWVVRQYSEKWIFRWFDEYREKYHKIGFVDFKGPYNTHWVFPESAKNYYPESPFWCMILERNEDQEIRKLETDGQKTNNLI